LLSPLQPLSGGRGRPGSISKKSQTTSYAVPSPRSTLCKMAGLSCTSSQRRPNSWYAGRNSCSPRSSARRFSWGKWGARNEPRGDGMLSAMVRFSLRFRGVVIALACALLGYGLYTLSRATYDVFPEFAPPQVVIQTEAPGLAPEQVEVLVTQPIENTLNGVAGIASLRSGSIQGLSVITVTFRPSSDIYRDRQVVAERLAALAGQLPAGVQAPVMTPLTSSTSVVLAVGLTSEERALM